jgi:hypothetical protein
MRSGVGANGVRLLLVGKADITFRFLGVEWEQDPNDIAKKILCNCVLE